MKYTEDMINDVAAILESHDGMDLEMVARAVLDGLTLPYVTITDETVDVFGRGWHAADRAGLDRVLGARRRAGLRAALESLGFLVRDDEERKRS